MRKDRRIKKPLVSISENISEEKSLEQCLNNLPMEDIIKKNDNVVITPNWVKAKSPSSATVVGPNTLDKLIKIVKKYNPKRVVIATGSGGDSTDKVMKYVGYDKVIKDNNVEFIDLNYGPYTNLKLNHWMPPSTKINTLYEQMDVLISFSQLKMHEEATMSGGIKNIALGWPPAEIHGFPKKGLGIHEDLHNFIVAMIEKMPIDLTILSADKTMLATGPSEGKAIDTQGIIIAGTDPVSVDTVGARLLGFLPQAVNYLYSLHRKRIGEASLENVDIRGLELEVCEKMFSTSAYNTEVVLDKGKLKPFHGNR
ncbi:MAG: DUF362 domain-containing protein [Firmicutes bacterium]|nr:DUF362 domain-containing protein [Bacillota bacterium]